MEPVYDKFAERRHLQDLVNRARLRSNGHPMPQYDDVAPSRSDGSLKAARHAFIGAEGGHPNR